MVMYQPDNIGAAQWADMDDITQRYPYDTEYGFWLGRDPHNYDRKIGYGINERADRHIFCTAGTRGGKGRSFIINNLVDWQGSIVSIDPKGENAAICAARRGDGDKYCHGMGQKVYVLDPYGVSDVEDKYRASCNLLSMIDPNSGSLISDCKELAEAMRISKDGGESDSWSQESAGLTALIIAHVVSCDDQFLEPHQRTLIQVREWLTMGSRDMADAMKQQGIDASPHLALFTMMQGNDAQQGAIRREAQSYIDIMEGNARQWSSIAHGAKTETSFLEDLQMKGSLTPLGKETRTLDLTDLRTHPAGVSIFICLPLRPNQPAIRWQKAIIQLMLNFWHERNRLPANNKRTLLCMDEFASMGKMENVVNSFETLGGAGVTMFIIVPNIVRLKTIYGDGWSGILGSCAVQIYFQIDENTTAEFLEKHFGQTQVVLTTQSESIAKTEAENWNESTTNSDTEGDSTSEGKSTATSEQTTENTTNTETTGTNTSQSDATNWNGSQSSNQSQTTGENNSSNESRNFGWNIGETHGTSESKGYNEGKSFTSGQGSGATSEPRFFFRDRITSTNQNTSSSKTENVGTNQTNGSNRSETKSNSGGETTGRTIGFSSSLTEGTSSSQSTGGSKTLGSGTNQSKAVAFSKGITHGTTQTLSHTYTTNRSHTVARALSLGGSKSQTITHGKNQTIHKRPLITNVEMNLDLGRVDDRDAYEYPGFALVRIANEQPFMVRKCHYDEDAEFEGKFTPLEQHRKNFLPFSSQRLLGCMYTDAHMLPIGLPDIVDEFGIEVSVELSKITDQWFNKSDELFVWDTKPLPDNGKYEVNPVDLNPTNVTAPYDGKVIDYALQDAFEINNAIMLVRFEKPMDDLQRDTFKHKIFEKLYAYLGALRARKEKEKVERHAKIRKGVQYLQELNKTAELEEQNRVKWAGHAKKVHNYNKWFIPAHYIGAFLVALINVVILFFLIYYPTTLEGWATCSIGLVILNFFAYLYYSQGISEFTSDRFRLKEEEKELAENIGKCPPSVQLCKLYFFKVDPDIDQSPHFKSASEWAKLDPDKTYIFGKERTRGYIYPALKGFLLSTLGLPIVSIVSALMIATVVWSVIIEKLEQTTKR